MIDNQSSESSGLEVQEHIKALDEEPTGVEHSKANFELEPEQKDDDFNPFPTPDTIETLEVVSEGEEEHPLDIDEADYTRVYENPHY